MKLGLNCQLFQFIRAIIFMLWAQSVIFMLNIQLKISADMSDSVK